MKRLIFFVLLVVVACSEEDDLTLSPSSDLAGIWVNYEVESPNGDRRNITPSESVFGVYAESIQIKSNGLYVPVIWYSSDNYDFKKEDKGKLVQSGNTLILSQGSWDMQFAIEKQEDDELWLRTTGDPQTPGRAGNTIPTFPEVGENNVLRCSKIVYRAFFS